MELIDLLIILIGVVLIASVSKRIDNTIVTLPMLYTLFGLFVGLVFFDFVESTITSAAVEIIATLALVVILALSDSPLLNDLNTVSSTGCVMLLPSSESSTVTV